MSTDLDHPTITPSNPPTRRLSFIENLHQQAVAPSDPWNITLDTIKGRVGSDGVERLSTEMILEWLDVPPYRRTAELAERIRGLMVRRGWIPVRARHATSKGHAARVRGYARLAENSAPMPSPSTPEV